MASLPPALLTVNSANSNTNFAQGVVFRLSAVQLTFGIVSILVGALCCALYSHTDFYLGYVGPGVWCGLAFLIAGIIGLISGRRPINQCLVVSLMVMSIFSGIFSLALLMFSVCSLIFVFTSLDHIIASIILLIIALIEGILSVFCAALCCRASCCVPTQTVVYYYPQQIYPEDNFPLPPPDYSTLPRNSIRTISGTLNTRLKDINQSTTVEDLPPSYDDRTQNDSQEVQTTSQQIHQSNVN